MTKEEKIAELINIRDNFNYALTPREVFDDAIKALEQEPCDDAVSRRAVLDTLDKMDSVLDENRTVETYKELLIACYNDLPPVTPTHTETVTEFADRCVECGNRYGRLLKQVTWIPCSERLPEVMDGSNGECSDDVLICVADDEQITISTGFYGYYPNSKTEQGWWSVWAYGCHQLDSKYKVIAWMPLPESYKAESEERWKN